MLGITARSRTRAARYRRLGRSAASATAAEDSTTQPADAVGLHRGDEVRARLGKKVVGRSLGVAERAEDRIASLHGAPHGVGARGVADDEGNAVVDLAGLGLRADERRDVVAGRARLADELATDAAGCAEDGQLHDAAPVAGSAVSLLGGLPCGSLSGWFM